VNPYQSHYDTLKVSRDAPPELVRRAYAELVRQLHPDRNEDKAECIRKLQAINASFEVLNNPAQRRAYDALILEKLAKSGPTSLPPLSASKLPAPTPPQPVQRKQAPVPFDSQTVPSAASGRASDSPPHAALHSISSKSNTPQKRSLALPIVLFLLISFGLGIFILQNRLSLPKEHIDIAPEEPATPVRTYNPAFDPPPTDFKLVGPSFSEPEVPLPEHGFTRAASGYEMIAPFTIKSSVGTNHLIKLTDSSNNKDAITVFVRGGIPVKVKAPLGRFTVKYASGETWYGNEHLFGPDTVYSKADEEFVFSRESSPESDAEIHRLAKLLEAADQKVKDYLIDLGTGDKTIRYIFDGEDPSNGLSGMDRISDDWWKKNILSKIKNEKTYNKLIKLINARYDISNDLIELQNKTTVSGYTITLYKVRDGNLKTSAIPKEEF